MAKDAYYFPHDANARHDPKTEAMMLRWGVQGYGIWWIIVEMMREHDDYQLPRKHYTYAAIAKQAMATPEQIEEFITSCIEEFDLLDADEHYFWSESLCRRMEHLDSVRVKRRESGRKGAEASNSANERQSRGTAAAPPRQTSGTAAAKSGKIKESKEKESKEESAATSAADTVIDYLNEKCGKQFRHSDTSRKYIRARLAEGYTIDDCKHVVDAKASQWLGTDMAQYLRPHTLFRPEKFEGYANEDLPNEESPPEEPKPFVDTTKLGAAI